MSPRSWLVVPLAALACAALALATRTPLEAIALALTGAAVATAVRAFVGGSPAASAAAAAGALLAVLGLLALHGDLVRAALAGAAAMFAIGEVVRPMPPTASPWPAIGAALVAGTLDPSFVPLVAIAGVKMMRGPWPLPRFAIAVPIAGGLAIALAIASGCLGALAPLWTSWAGAPPHALVATTAARIGDALGPLACVAALAGLAIAATRGRYAMVAVLGVALASLAVDLRCAAFGTATAACAALATGVAIGRLAAMIRIPVGQLALSATTGFMLLVAPVWAIVG